MFDTRVMFVQFLFILSLHNSLQCPIDDISDTAKAAYKSGEIPEPTAPITLEIIKAKLRDTGIFDERTAVLNERERKELKKLFDAVEIMTSSRNRQPQNVQNMFSSLRLVERVVKKQLKEGQISESLASKFHWDKLSNRQKREEPMFVMKETSKISTNLTL